MSDYLDAIMRGMTYNGGNRFKAAWFMFAACRAHGLAYGLTFREWLPDAWHNARGAFLGTESAKQDEAS